MNGSSVVFCFEMAVVQQLVEKGIISKDELANKFREYRKYIPRFSPFESADRVILDYLNIKEEENGN